VQSAQKLAGGDEFIPTRSSLLSRLKRWDDQEGWRDFFDTYWKVAKTLHANVAQVYLAKHRVTALIKQETEKLRKRMEAEP